MLECEAEQPAPAVEGAAAEPARGEAGGGGDGAGGSALWLLVNTKCGSVGRRSAVFRIEGLGCALFRPWTKRACGLGFPRRPPLAPQGDGGEPANGARVQAPRSLAVVRVPCVSVSTYPRTLAGWLARVSICDASGPAPAPAALRAPCGAGIPIAASACASHPSCSRGCPRAGLRCAFRWRGAAGQCWHRGM